MLSDKDGPVVETGINRPTIRCGLRAPDLVWKGTRGKPERTALCGVRVGPNVHGQIASQKSPLKIMNVKKKKKSRNAAGSMGTKVELSLKRGLLLEEFKDRCKPLH